MAGGKRDEEIIQLLATVVETLKPDPYTQLNERMTECEKKLWITSTKVNGVMWAVPIILTPLVGFIIHVANMFSK